VTKINLNSSLNLSLCHDNDELFNDELFTRKQLFDQTKIFKHFLDSHKNEISEILGKSSYS
jgi:hypothetical protein